MHSCKLPIVDFTRCRHYKKADADYVPMTRICVYLCMCGCTIYICLQVLYFIPCIMILTIICSLKINTWPEHLFGIHIL